jgi:hypothetical protein
VELWLYLLAAAVLRLVLVVHPRLHQERNLFQQFLLLVAAVVAVLQVAAVLMHEAVPVV